MVVWPEASSRTHYARSCKFGSRQVNIDVGQPEVEGAEEEKKEVDFFEDLVNNAAPPSPDALPSQPQFAQVSVREER